MTGTGIGVGASVGVETGVGVGDGEGDGDGGNGAGTGTAGGEKENSPKARSAGYGLVHRIGDNIHVEINRIHIVFQPLGRFKTRRVGPWTPPALTMTLRNFRYVSVDEHGDAAGMGNFDDASQRNRSAASGVV